MERYSHPVPFEVGDLASYLITQSNLQAAIQSGEQAADKLRAWLIAETDQFFGSTTESFTFAGYVAAHRRKCDYQATDPVGVPSETDVRSRALPAVVVIRSGLFICAI